MRLLLSQLVLLLLTLSNASLDPTRCAAVRGRGLRSGVLGNSCGAHPAVALRGTVCVHAERARSVEGYEIRITSARALQGLMRSLAPREPILILFYGRCRFSAHVLPMFIKATSRLSVCALAVEVHQFPALGATFGVHGLPTIMRILNGQPTSRFAGKRTYRRILKWAMNVTQSQSVSRPRKAMEHVPVLHVPDPSSQPDFVLAASIAICSVALMVRLLKREEHLGVGEH